MVSFGVEDEGRLVWLLRIPLRMCRMNAFVIPRPRFWSVDICGVGAVCERPYYLRVLCVFQKASAERRIPVGAGCLVARSYMMCAYGRVCGKGSSGIVDEGVVRNDWRIGPHRPCGSMTKGMRMVLVLLLAPTILHWPLALEHQAL